MHHIIMLLFCLGIATIIHARSSSSMANYRSCPEEYRELRRRDDGSSSDSADDDEDSDDLCAVAMIAAARQQGSGKSQTLLRTYCAYFDEAMALARANNDTLCEMEKRALTERSVRRNEKRQMMKKKRYDDDDENDEDDKRRALRKRTLRKRLAVRFLRKSLS